MSDGLRAGPSNPGAKPRFQSLPGPKPVLGLGRVGPTPPWAVVAEGLFDWLTLAGWGLPAITSLGTQGLDRVTSALRGCPRVFLAFDNDDAGREASERLADLLGRRAAVVTLPQAWATWQSLLHSPMDGPSSYACLNRPPTPPGSNPRHPTDSRLIPREWELARGNHFPSVVSESATQE